MQVLFAMSTSSTAWSEGADQKNMLLFIGAHNFHGHVICWQHHKSFQSHVCAVTGLAGTTRSKDKGQGREERRKGGQEGSNREMGVKNPLMRDKNHGSRVQTHHCSDAASRCDSSFALGLCFFFFLFFLLLNLQHHPSLSVIRISKQLFI